MKLSARSKHIRPDKEKHKNGLAIKNPKRIGANVNRGSGRGIDRGMPSIYTAGHIHLSKTADVKHANLYITDYSQT